MLNGYAVAHGLPDLRGLRVGAFLDYVWYMLTRNADDDAVQRFRRALWMPPKGVAPDPRSPWAPAAETAAFQAVKSMTTGNAPVDAAPSMRERAAAARRHGV